ncbi:DUF1348-domain-containing protein [Wilcoxina mikolae CBS 423.85]|nr:DUF1348-domain-containing protein [Wilcoxina mikolae CBS 423.85]
MAGILPPFTAPSAHSKVKAAQNLWNTRDPQKVALAYTPDSIWRNRATFLRGTAEITEFLSEKWKHENGYRLRKELFSFSDDKIAVQFWYEYFVEVEDEGRKWYRCYGLEDWTFAQDGKMRKRMMSGNDVEIVEEERWFKDGVDVDDVKIGEEHW